jgi:hypothetical protein
VLHLESSPALNTSRYTDAAKRSWHIFACFLPYTRWHDQKLQQHRYHENTAVALGAAGCLLPVNAGWHGTGNRFQEM